MESERNKPSREGILRHVSAEYRLETQAATGLAERNQKTEILANPNLALSNSGIVTFASTGEPPWPSHEPHTGLSWVTDGALNALVLMVAGGVAALIGAPLAAGTVMFSALAFTMGRLLRQAHSPTKFFTSMTMYAAIATGILNLLGILSLVISTVPMMTIALPYIGGAIVLGFIDPFSIVASIFRYARGR